MALFETLEMSKSNEQLKDSEKQENSKLKQQLDAQGKLNDELNIRSSALRENYEKQLASLTQTKDKQIKELADRMSSGNEKIDTLMKENTELKREIKDLLSTNKNLLADKEGTQETIKGLRKQHEVDVFNLSEQCKKLRE